MDLRFPFDHPEIAAVLTRLHKAADADNRKLPGRAPAYFWAKITGRLNEPTTRRRLFADLYSAVTPARGALLYVLARAVQAKRVVEFGSSFGISTIYLAAAVRDNVSAAATDDVSVVGSEMEPAKAEQARKNIDAAGLGDLVTILQGDAMETLREVAGPIDFAFLDGRKELYLPVLKLLESKLRAGAMIVADNIDSFRSEVAPFLEYVQTPRNRYASMTAGVNDGMEISIFERGERC
ncbi:MAG TPA: class I SAM-dependent methyltransferase [Candidatus Aquilonibacter sp.]|nr:class I SAM-dependent methyltransferase [Candidatus Aquilonibacter sp.]